VLFALGVVERRRHLANVARIPIRVHVNGSRGKSSVTRLIAAGLREGGVRTFAKTSGTETVEILPDGSERPVRRANRTSVIEQVGIVAEAAAAGADALVIECMALQPELQSLTELEMVRATHGVITNVGPDHLDVMGPGESEVAQALAGTVPAGGKVFTAEERYVRAFEDAAADRRATLVKVGDSESLSIEAEELDRFDHVEHPSNVALALAVCEDLGVPRATALEGMWRARCDAGAMRIHEVRPDGKHLVIVSAFAANDPRSSQTAWDLAARRFPELTRRIVLANCRADRPDRSRRLGAACARWDRVDHCLVMGKETSRFKSAASRAGLARERISTLEGAGPQRVFDALVDLVDRSALVVGIGNAGRGGLEFVEFLNRSDFEKAERC